MGRQPVPVSPYDTWIKEQRNTHTEAAANVVRIDRDISELTAKLDALFAERTEQVALRDHTATVIELNPAEYRERAKHGQWQLSRNEGDDQ